VNDINLTLLHGWGMPAGVFDPLLTRLRQRCRPHAPALPGYAGSSWPAGLGFEQQLERMADELPAGALLGWSLGGLYALELGLRYPRKFTALTLVACNPCFVIRDDWPCAVAAAVFDAFADELRGDWRRALRRFISLQLQGEAAQRELARDLWRRVADQGPPAPAVLEAGLELLRDHDARPALARLEQPVKLLLGTRDRLVPIALGQQIAEVARGIRVESVADAAHAPFLSHPAEIADLVDLTADRTC